MARPTTMLRQVWRDVNDGNEDRRVLVLQQFFQAEGWEHPTLYQYDETVEEYGYWRDVDIASED